MLSPFSWIPLVTLLLYVAALVWCVWIVLRIVRALESHAESHALLARSHKMLAETAVHWPRDRDSGSQSN